MCISQRKLCASITKTAQLLLYREVTAVYFQIRIKHKYKMWAEHRQTLMLLLAVRIAIPGGGRKNVTLLEGCQAGPACPSGRSSMKIQMKMYQAESFRISTVAA
jgi:hypothetical protein